MEPRYFLMCGLVIHRLQANHFTHTPGRNHHRLTAGRFGEPVLEGASVGLELPFFGSLSALGLFPASMIAFLKFLFLNKSCGQAQIRLIVYE